MRASLFGCAKLLPSRWSCFALQHSQHASSRLKLLERTTLAPNRRIWTTAPLLKPIGDEAGQQDSSAIASQHGEATISPIAASSTPAFVTSIDALPLVCPGCGAPSQIIDKTAPGYYGRTHTQKPSNIVQKLNDEDAIFAAAIARGAIAEPSLPDQPPPPDETPICDRCHRLVHENTGTSIIHPSMDSIRAMIEESPHRHNHIYHIIDAVDFPMSVIPNLQSSLRLPRLRTKNRRSKHVQYISGRVAEVSFIVTRADLLAPKKEQADALLPYMRDILRKALGRLNRNARLGNIRMVSAKRGWWTPVLKEEIYKRGGAGWMVGKVNVGKSALMEVVYPKGKSRDLEPTRLTISSTDEAHKSPVTGSTQSSTTDPGSRMSDALSDYAREAKIDLARPSQELEITNKQAFHDTDDLEAKPLEQEESTDADFIFDETDLTLLPPAQTEKTYPTMPIISSLPGTTASPIRLPFGRGRGELIDLPGVERTALSEYILPEHQKHLIMHHRIVPEQHVLQPGQSLLLGGVIRITPKTEDVTFLMYPFLPTALQGHSTKTEKAIAIQTGRYADTGEPYEGNTQSSATQTAKSSIRSAGTFALQWDVTKKRAGPVTEKTAGRMKPENLAFIVYGIDILIEGSGWVEVVAQVRRPRRDSWDQSAADIRPEVEVFSPEGTFVAVRPPMNAWMINKPPKGSSRKRPRQTISYKKRMEGGRVGSLKKMAVDS